MQSQLLLLIVSPCFGLGAELRYRVSEWDVYTAGTLVKEAVTGERDGEQAKRIELKGRVMMFLCFRCNVT
jgi:hypothetical protein